MVIDFILNFNYVLFSVTTMSVWRPFLSYRLLNNRRTSLVSFFLCNQGCRNSAQNEVSNLMTASVFPVFKTRSWLVFNTEHVQWPHPAEVQALKKDFPRKPGRKEKEIQANRWTRTGRLERIEDPTKPKTVPVPSTTYWGFMTRITFV